MSAILEYIRLDDAYANKTLLLNFCTAIGAFGGMPNPPKILTQLTEKFWPLQWLLVVILVYQGGGEQDFHLAIEVTIICFIIYRILAVIDGEPIIPGIDLFKSEVSDEKE